MNCFINFSQSKASVRKTVKIISDYHITYFMVYRILSFLWFCVDTAHKDIYDTLYISFFQWTVIVNFLSRF